MKAIRIHEYGHSDRIQVEDAPRPSFKPDEVLVKIRAAGINPVDWKIREGYMAGFSEQPFPLTLGQDFSGEIVEVGEEVKNFKSGDEVFGFADGAYAEYATASEGGIARKPKSLDFNAAAALPSPASTAYQMVTDVVRPEKGQRVLIHGAGGGVGGFATQLCLWRGANVIATASKASEAYLRDLGVQEIIDYKSERFEERVSSVGAVIDLVGGEIIERSLPLVKRKGVLVTAVGPLNEEQARRREIRGVQFIMSKSSRDLAEIAKLVDQGILKIHLTRVFPLEQAREAQDFNQQGRSHGKVVLRVA